MSLDYKKSVYKPTKAESTSSNRTSYGAMCQWMTDANLGREYRRSLPLNLLVQNNASPQFTKKRVRTKPPQPILAMSDQSFCRRAAIDEDVPVHLRYSNNCGYDDFHRAFRTISNQWPSLSYPTFGPPRLRHGRSGGSWRHVKEVLQAGGARITFVDGRVTENDNYVRERIPGGHLILPAYKKRDLTPDSRENRRRKWEINESLENRHRQAKQLRTTTYGSVSKQKAVEHNNWMVMR